MKKSILIYIFCLMAVHVFGYHAPLGTRLGYYTNSFDKVFAINFSHMATSPAGTNCFTFIMKMNIPNHTHGGIFSLHDVNSDVYLFKIGFLENGKMYVARNFENKGMVEYDIYDQLLDFSGSGSKQYEFRIFLCGVFFWLEVTNTAQPSKVAVTPLFWGINTPKIHMINQLINKNSNYEWIYGDLQNTSPTLVHMSFEVYGSKFSDLLNDIQTNYVAKATARSTSPEAGTPKISMLSPDAIKVYPLMVENELNIDLELTKGGAVEYAIYSIQGALLYRNKKMYAAPGIYHEEVSRHQITGSTQMGVILIQTPDGAVSEKIMFK